MSLDMTQKFIVDYRKHCLVIACPGGGKTRVLVFKAKHILMNDPSATIMIASFTKDSASEIRIMPAEPFKITVE